MDRSLAVVVIVVVAALAACTAAARPTAVELTTPRGTRVSVVVTWPKRADAQSPALIIAPGGTYHAAIPLVRRLAEQAPAHGFVAVRFDWSFCRSAGERCAGVRSADGRAEREDLETVIAFVRAHARVDRARILLAAKSFGSTIAYPVFAADRALAALLVLTPICTEASGATASRHYPALQQLGRPALFAIGTADPICDVATLRDHVAAAPGSATILELPGDHGFALGESADFAAQNAANLDAAVDGALRWAASIAR